MTVRPTRAQARPPVRRHAKKKTKRILRHKKAAAKKTTTRTLTPTPKPVAAPPHVLGVAETFSTARADTSSPLVLTAFLLAIMCFGAGAIPAGAIGRASVAHVLAQRRAGLTALGVTFLAIAVALLAAKVG